MLSPSYSPTLAACVEYKILLLANKAAKGPTHAHQQATVQAYTHQLCSAFSATTGHSARQFNSLPVWLWFQWFPLSVSLPLPSPSLILQFLLKYPVYVYFITIYCNSGLLVGFCKFYGCTPIKLPRMRASVKLMKCKCQSFCLPLFFILSPLVHERMSMLWLKVHLNIKLSVT